MDSKKVGIYFTSGLMLVSIVVLLYMAMPAKAQNGSCPDWTTGMSPIPHGYYPGSIAMCFEAPLMNRITHVQGLEYPCQGGVQIDAWDPGNQGQARMYLVMPSGMTFPSGRARLRFQMALDRVAISQYDVIMRATGYTPNDEVIEYRDLYVEAFSWVMSQDFGAEIYTIETDMPFVQGGYFTIEVQNPTGPFYIFDVYIFGVKIQDSNHWPPQDYCEVNGNSPPTLTPTPSRTPTGTPPPTNTPQPSNTPTGTPPNTPTYTNTPPHTNTPTHTPTPQTYPTAPGGTSTPFPTRTPKTVPTVPAAPTPTRLGVISFPTLELPVFDGPAVLEIGTAEAFNLELTPNATLQADGTRLAGLSLESQAVISRWYTATNWASGMFSLTITNTTGLSNVVEIAGVMSESVTVPFTYARALRNYVPNLWPLILFLLLGTGWILFTLLLKWIIPLFTFVLDLIKKLPFA